MIVGSCKVDELGFKGHYFGGRVLQLFWMSSSRKPSSGQQVASALESSSTPLPVKRGRGRPKGTASRGVEIVGQPQCGANLAPKLIHLPRSLTPRTQWAGTGTTRVLLGLGEQKDQLTYPAPAARALVTLGTCSCDLRGLTPRGLICDFRGQEL